MEKKAFNNLRNFWFNIEIRVKQKKWVLSRPSKKDRNLVAAINVEFSSDPSIGFLSVADTSSSTKKKDKCFHREKWKKQETDDVSDKEENNITCSTESFPFADLKEYNFTRNTLH